MNLYDKYKQTNRLDDNFIYWLFRRCMSHIPVYAKLYNKYRKYSLGEQVKSFGHEYADKIFYVIRPNADYTGLMGLYRKVVEHLIYADEKGYIPVIDFKKYKNMYRNKGLFHTNSWEQYWKQPAGYTPEKIKRAKNVIIAAKCIDIIKDSCSTETTDYVSPYVRMIPFSDCAAAHLETKYREFISKCGQTSEVLGVLARGTDYASLQPHKHSKVPTVEELFEKIEEKQTQWKSYSYIFLATEDIAIHNCFQKKYGDRLITSGQELYPSNTRGKALSQIRKNRKDDCYVRGLEYLTTIYLLSKCDALIGSRVGGTAAALWWSGGGYKNVYLFDLGEYE